MADPTLRQRTKRRGDQDGVVGNGNGNDVPRNSSTLGGAPVKIRKRTRDRPNGDAAHDFTADDPLEEVSSESVWLDGPLALTLLPPLGSFLTGGTLPRNSIAANYSNHLTDSFWPI